MSQSARFLALDVFRGMTVCFMIIVNTPGSWSHIYAPLEHAPWHGFTSTDLVFPSFLFAVGNAMAFVMHKYESQGSSAFWRKTLRRTALIFLIGFMLSWFPFFDKMDDGSWQFAPFSETRILGVLGRIALCYLFASVILHYASKKAAIVFSVFALVGYWIIMYAFGDPNDPYSLVGNAALKLDLAILGENHMYHGEGIAFDPEGLLSTLPAVVNVIIGFLAGDFIRRKGSNYETISKLMIAGCALMFVALCWDMVFPINKKIWTSSFVLLTTGIDMLVLAFLIYMIEMVKYKKGTYFFEVFGKNPLFIYALSGILITIMFMIPVGESSLQGFFYRDVFGSFAGPTFASFLFAIFYMMMLWWVGYWLDMKKIYIKV
jgi:predicted acyltransferase